MTEQKKEEKKEVAVDLECDDEFEEFGNEGESRAPEATPGSAAPRTARSPLRENLTLARSSVLTVVRPPSFDRAEWGAEEEDAEDVNQWEEDWDDSEKSDEFTRQLRAELEKFA